MLAAANALSGDADLIAGTQLKVPEMAASKNDAASFKPYNPNEIVGSTSPGLPYVPSADLSCKQTMILIATTIVRVVATVYGGVGGAMIADALMQQVEIKAGIRSEYSLGETVAAGIFAAFGPVIQSASTWAKVGYSAVAAATAYSASYLVDKSRGADVHFNWGSLAASVVTSMISTRLGAVGNTGVAAGGSVSATVSNTAFSWTKVATDTLKNLGISAVNKGVTQLITGDKANWDAGGMFADSFGNAAGNAVVEKIQLVLDSRRLKQVISTGKMDELDDTKQVVVENGPVARDKEEIAAERKRLGLSKSEYRVYADLLPGEDGELENYNLLREKGVSHADAITQVAPLLSQDPNALRFYQMEVSRISGDVINAKIVGRVSPDDLEGAVFVNGILNPRDRAAELSGYHLDAEFNLSAGDNYYLMHNPTKSAVADLWESFRDKIGWSSVAAQEVANVLERASADGRELKIVAHSQAGALVTEGIRVANKELGHQLRGIEITYHSGANNQWATNRILKSAGVTTFGGLQAPGYRDAPNDLVPQIVGFNWLPDPSKLMQSLIDSRLLFSKGNLPSNTASPHTFPYLPNQGLYPKLSMPIPKK